MAAKRSQHSFAKRQRELEKARKAQEKRERRQRRKEEKASSEETDLPSGVEPVDLADMLERPAEEDPPVE